MFASIPQSLIISRRRVRRASILLVSSIVAGLVLGWLLRYQLTAFAVRSGLERAGAGDIEFTIIGVSPWSVEVANLGFRIRNQSFAADRVSIARAHWWQSNLGTILISGAKIPLIVDGSDLNPRAWPSYSGTDALTGPPVLPADHFSIDGVITVKAADVADREVQLHLDATLMHPVDAPVADKNWMGHVRLVADGLEVAADGNLAPSGRGEFHTTALAVDLKSWQEIIQRLGVIPGGPWQVDGKGSGSLVGTWQDRKWTLSGSVHLAGLDVRNDARNVAVLGASADFAVLDFLKFRTQPGTIQVRELRAGDFSASDLSFQITFANVNTLQVAQAKLSTLGGSLSAEPFTYQLNKNELDATVVADGLDVEQILSLSKNLSGAAVGRVGGRLPLRIDSAGVRFGTGWLALKPGLRAEVTLRSAGLLTTGVATSSPSYAVLKKIETGLTRLKVSEMRLDVRPPNAPPGRTAELHLVGEPVDPNLKAPITLDLNVNGPVEQLINLSLDRRVRLGTGK
ncbi:MAG TPA: YdbH domain-containing protein [Candidatus Didemnitutus sp.]|nr:YdbH domain-containing protein [Candidatus Didemnitutus sp.]